ncbi:hypothetical protein [Aeromonas sobria]|uniref:hypothetical protein n=1 Tax=Aeromonas sobria TaxID=646 RepID=UPI0026E97CD5|nr:hypothetical protein [Aeromonas sobria]
MSTAAKKLSSQIAIHVNKINALLSGEAISKHTESELSFLMGFMHGLHSALECGDMVGMTQAERHNLVIELENAVWIIPSFAADGRKRIANQRKGGFINTIKRIFN